MDNERKYNYVPEEFREEYEIHLKKEEAAKRITKTLEKQRKEFIDSIKSSNNLEKESIDRWKEENDKKMVEQAFDILVKYCIEKNIKKYKTCQKGDLIIISYLDEKGNEIKELFSVKELIRKQNQEQK